MVLVIDAVLPNSLRPTRPQAGLIRLARIPAGSFEMGAAAGDKFATDTERPRHRVVFAKPFAIGSCPVTVAEFRAFRPSHEPQSEGAWPVANVSWHDALAYCAWLSAQIDRPVRLPSEAEWEYACRAGSDQPFSTGATLSPSEANFLYSEQGERIGFGRRVAVGAYAANAFGVHDAHGNVCEWVLDSWTATYDGAPTDGRARGGAPGASARRVIRGGAWDHLPRLLRCAWRDALPDTARRDNVGFRIAADLDD